MKIRAAEHFATCAGPGDFPPARPHLPEVAFLGRSNVGKSSLLNRLVARRQLARTSGTPGKTRLIHFYKVAAASRELLLVDLPGYGWAKVSRKERESWQRLVERYLEDRPVLCAAVLLQDLRREPGEDEELLLEWLAERKISSLVALTKVDKLKPGKRAGRQKELQARFPMAEQVIATSAEKGTGIAELWRAILERLP
ncbi:MAG: ribosome biogenesis GTP-binding protein YihA/YsxC [Proteobacteria bacterium]|nr:ribosome biogenesis GTP-binding protein YihA/YsxC [Pseudomonadota bacterium]MCZ6783133.1 ribosome biogenesis GTP-binding protein YihA/YsxC [Pseudomonadota bacterium]